MRTGLEYALRRVHSAEQELTEDLLHIADKHRSEHEIHHVCLDVARWSQENLAALAEVAANYDVHLDAEVTDPGPLRHALDALAAKTPGRPASIALLEDLRDLFLVASETSLAWEMLAQHAQARRERDLLELVTAAHPQTLRQLRWVNTMIKTLSPQALASHDA
ncbi:MAG: hypothetical protein JF597_49330 [Streptomyces sp.]|uniref:hypothetical protein n=1 Tax=Streptomyces sp. TaxID=1931 RepID=UPI0025E95A34|nr:hypothetical protein [Streptomyces sp.]MBW8801273.1 hypothetical protein [Streptomyces sp.]